jgi:hypothetical protein
LKEWTTPEFRNTPSTTNLEEEEIVDAPGNDDNASMPEEVKRHNPRRKVMMMIMTMMMVISKLEHTTRYFSEGIEEVGNKPTTIRRFLSLARLA